MPELNLPLAPSWSLALGYFGKALIYLSIISFALTAILALLSKKERSHLRPSRFLFHLGTASILTTLSILIVLFVTNQFHFAYVFNHSDITMPAMYKFAAAWSGQEGSFLLWACSSAIFGSFSIKQVGAYQRHFSIAYGLIQLALCSILAYETPFNVNYVHNQPFLPPSGLGLQPTLLNFWVIIHPPTIFLGFGSLTVLFCWAISALLLGSFKDWAKQIRPWALISFTLLGIGLCMGGFWAYETLGWGGFWAWDPVENSSFVPWCLLVALIHGLYVQIKKDRWHLRNALLAGLSFLSFVYGTFLTRSGILADTSVHSFAQMDRYALQLLVALLAVGFLVFIGFWIKAFKAKQHSIQKGSGTDAIKKTPFLTREPFFNLASWLTSTIGIAAAIGMSVPLIKSLLGQKIAIVEAELYHQILVWLFVPLMALMAIGPFLSWQIDNAQKKANGLSAAPLWVKFFNLTALAIGIVGIVFILLLNPNLPIPLDSEAVINFPLGWKVKQLPWMLFLIGLLVFTGSASIWKLYLMVRKKSQSIGSMIAHLGFVLLLAGLIISKGFEQAKQFYVQDGHPGTAFGYWIRFKGMTESLLHRDNRIIFEVSSNQDKFQIAPSLYYISKIGKEPEPIAWPYIHHRPFYDLYFTIGPAIYEASDPLTLKQGEFQFFNRKMITYKSMKRSGGPMMIGAKFTTELEIKTLDETYTISPALKVTKNGLKYYPAKAGKNLLIYLQKMSPEDHAATLQFYYIKPVYPMELYYKPMTILVWLGAGLVGIGGILSFLNRKRQASPLSSQQTPEEGLKPN